MIWRIIGRVMTFGVMIISGSLGMASAIVKAPPHIPAIYWCICMLVFIFDRQLVRKPA
jgi:hypothetical protein